MFNYVELYRVAVVIDLIKRMNEMNDRNRVMQFLRGLSDQFEGVRNYVLSKDVLPSINMVFCLVTDRKPKGGVNLYT